MCDSDDNSCEDVILLSLLYLRWKRRQRRSRRMWIQPIVNDRSKKSQYSLFAELRKNEEKFSDFTRMSTACFDELLNCLREKITKRNTRMRTSIPAEEKLVIALRYLATGCSQTDLHYTFRVGKSTASSIIKEVCEAIWLCLAETAIPQPSTEKWLEIAGEFERDANFPNCLGPIAGKYVKTKRDPNSFSTVLFAMCDINYCFTYVEVGPYGECSDPGIFKISKLFDKLRNGSLGIPPPRFLENSNEKYPYVIVGDPAFPLMENLLKPYAGRRLPDNKNAFNAKLLKARKYIEGAFRILANKWQIFYRPLGVDLNAAESIIKAACVLHNFIRARDRTHEELGQDAKMLYCNMPSLEPGYNRGNSKALAARDKLSQYFAENIQ